MTLSLAGTGTLLAFLLWSPFEGEAPLPRAKPPAGSEAVQLTGSRTLVIRPDSLLAKKLKYVRAKFEEVNTPVLTVTGSVVARLGSGKDSAPTRWDFATPDLATAYADWLKARDDEPFAEEQLVKIKELTAARVKAQTLVTERLRKLVEVGTEAAKDLAAAETELLQAHLQGRKEVFEAGTAVKNARRTRATLERQLFQAGIDPNLLRRASEGDGAEADMGKADKKAAKAGKGPTEKEKAAEGLTLVGAEVPEARISLVKIGQQCAARFFAVDAKVFPGEVRSFGPALSRERRTLRVFFELHDPNHLLRPGLFAEIGLGTEERRELLVPADAVLHVGVSDFVLAGGKAGDEAWHIAEVKVGETHGHRVEIRSGLQAGQRVVGAGAVLLQPLVTRALQE